MTTRKSNLTLTNLAAKKLLGKAHTSNIKDVSNEPYPSNVSVVSEGVFGEPIPNSPGADFYTLYSASAGGPVTVEKIYFDVVSDSSTIYDADSAGNAGPGDESSESGPHGYYLKLTNNYETTSSNPNRGTGSFTNNARLYNSRGALQIVPPFISTENPNPYQLKLYNSGNQEISFTDNIDWTVDYYAGTIFIQDYVSQVSGISKVPVSASAYIYVGKYLDDKINSISSSAGGNVEIENDGSSLTTAVTLINFTGSGVVASNSGNEVTVTIDGGGSGNATAQGPTGSLQFHSTGGQISGSSNLIFLSSSNTLNITGTLNVSGAINANELNINVTNKTVINLEASGSTKFGDTIDDNHQFTGSILVSGTIIRAREPVTSVIYTMTATDYIIGVDTATIGELSMVILPAANTLQDGQSFVIKDEGGDAQTYNIKITASASDLIDGVSEAYIESPYGAVNIYTNGSNKFFIY